MNCNTKNPQMEHCPCPKYGTIYKPDMCNLEVRKKKSKTRARVKTHLSKYTTTK